MNFYDEAIETKHGYLKSLVQKDVGIKKVVHSGTLGFKPCVDLEHLFDRDIGHLRTAESYFWDPRITQFVLASGQQLPESARFHPSWLPAPSGWWWFGRSSPLIGLSKDSERKYCNALLYGLEGDKVHISTYWMEGTAMHPLGSLVWEVGDSLAETLGKIKLATSSINATHTIKIGEVLDSAISQLRTAQTKADDLKTQIASVQSRIHELEVVLTDEGKAEFHLLKTDEERIAWLQRLQDVPETPLAHNKVERPDTEYEASTRLRLVDWKEASLNALATFACGSLWLQQKIVVTEPGRLERAAQRRLDRAGILSKCLVVHLRRKEYVRHAEGESEPVDWAWQWAVRGHWRNQPVKEGHKLIFIHPFIKGPEDAPLKPGAERILAVTR